jgi:hypothetical protein
LLSFPVALSERLVALVRLQRAVLLLLRAVEGVLLAPRILGAGSFDGFLLLFGVQV